MRKHADVIFEFVSLGALLVALAALAALVFDLVSDGGSRLSWQFLTNIASRNAENAGVYHALMGSIWVIALTGALALPAGSRRRFILRSTARAAGRRASLSSTSQTWRRCRRLSTACWAWDCSSG